MDEASASLVQSMNWAGSIPVLLSLAPSSLSSPTMPPPIHHMISRMTYLHLGLRHAILRFYKFAPSFPLQQLRNSNASTAENIDDSNKDMFHSSSTSLDRKNSDKLNSDSTLTNTTINNKNTNEVIDDMNDDDLLNFPMCWFEDVETGHPLRWHLFVGILFDLLSSKKKSNLLPWKIRIHFTSYPSHQILQFDNLKTIQLYYIHSLKQSLYLQYGSSKKAMSLSKIYYETLWNSMRRGACFELYQDVNLELQQLDRGSLMFIPIRIMINGKPMIQKPFKNNCNNIKNKYEETEEIKTLGCVFHKILPEFFVRVNSNSNNQEIQQVQEKELAWSIHGIQPRLTSDIVEIWFALCSPDHFLYICVSY